MINIDADAEMTFEEAINTYRTQVAGNRWGSAARTLNGMRPNDAVQVVKQAHARSQIPTSIRRGDVRRLLGEIGLETDIQLRTGLKAYLDSMVEVKISSHGTKQPEIPPSVIPPHDE